jgi:hypothetical protein
MCRLKLSPASAGPGAASARLVVEKEWPAMAEHKSSPEVWDAYAQLWRTYYQFQPQNESEKIWYTVSITRLNDLGDQRRLRLLSSRLRGVPVIIWVVLLGAGAITIGFTFLFGTRNAAAQVVMSSGLGTHDCASNALDHGAGTTVRRD